MAVVTRYDRLPTALHGQRLNVDSTLQESRSQSPAWSILVAIAMTASRYLSLD